MKYSLSLFLFIICKVVSANVHTVTNLNDSGPGSLRQACLVANSGDTITFSSSLLNNGNDTIHLNSNIALSQSLVLKGINTDNDTLFISGEGVSQIFYVDLALDTRKSLFFSDLALVKGRSTTNGGAISVINTDSIYMDRVLFKGNTCSVGYNGGACYIVQGVLSISNSRFLDNRVLGNSGTHGGSGGAIHVTGSSLKIKGSEFIHNQVLGSSTYGGYGGGLNASGSFVQLDSCFFSDNQSNRGGAVRVFRYDCEVSNSTFVNNFTTNSDGSGGALLLSCNTSISNCFFEHNLAMRSGGAVAVYSDSVQVEKSQFYRNESLTTYQFGGGGALDVSGKRIELTDIAVLYNSSNSRGGGLYLNTDSLAHVTNATIARNYAQDKGGGVNVSGVLGGHTFFRNVTIAFNSATREDCLSSTSRSSSTTIMNSILEGRIRFHDPNTTSAGFNIYSSYPTFADLSDLEGVDSISLYLEPITNNGGFGLSMVPMLNSPALHAGTPTDFSPAQNGPIYGRRDIGAAEARTIISDTLLACSPISWWGKTYSTAGIYTDTVFNANSIDSVGILVLERQDTTIVNQNAVLLVLEDDANTTYQWVDCDNGYAPIVGETSMSFTPATNGNYAVILTNGTCSDTSACILYDEVSIAEDNGQPSLRYYPNPTSGQLTIATTGELPNHVSILDLSGRPVSQLELESNTIQLPELKAGMYILQWKWESGRVVTSRVVVR